MARWKDFADQAPEMAALGQRILSKYGIAYLATIRFDDGWPRLHPISPAIVHGGIYLGIISSSPKRRDLDSDGRCVVHGLPGPRDAEICLIGTARPVSGDEVEDLILRAGPHVRISRDAAMYELDLQRVECTTYEVGVGPYPRPTRTRWSPCRTEP